MVESKSTDKYTRMICSVLALFMALPLLSYGEMMAIIPDKTTLDTVEKSPAGSVVYFGKIDVPKSEREIYEILKKLEIGAKALKDYGIHFFKVNCHDAANDLKKDCDAFKNRVVIFSNNDKEVLEFQLLFDVDHIVGHVLMAVLKDDVGIAQDQYMWDDVLQECRASKDIILGLFRGIGDREHRFFMEAAFVYGKQYKFVMTTEKKMPGIKGDGSLWYYHCKNAAVDQECEHKVRKMPPNGVLDIIRFIKLDGIQRIVEMNEDGSSSLDNMDVTFPVSKVFLFSDSIEIIRQMAEAALPQIDESFYFILVNAIVHQKLLAGYGIDPEIDWSVAGAQLVLQPSHLVGSEQKYYEQWPIDLDFTDKNIVKLLTNYHKNPNLAYQDVVDIVNIKYIPIADWKPRTQILSIVGGCTEDMDGCESFKIAFRRAARSVVYSQLNAEFELIYVDFTGSPDDAKLNTLPGFLVIKDGKEVKHKGATDYDSLIDFLQINLDKSVRHLPLSGSDHIPLMEAGSVEEDTNTDGEEEDEQKTLMQMEDDAMGKLAVDINKRKVQDEDVVSLTDKTFPKTKDSNELMVTLFFLPWCVKSLALRDQYAQVAKVINDNQSKNVITTVVNKVNCFNWEDVCRNEKVIMYPTIKVYRKGVEPLVYSGSLDIKTLENTIRMYQMPVVKELIDDKSVKQFLDVQAAQPSPTSVLGLFTSTNDKELKSFKDAAEKMFGKYSFAYAAGNIAKESATSMKAAVPSFVLLKRDDPAETMIASKDFNQLEQFVERHSLPTYGELTAVNFPKYKILGKPFIVNFKSSDDTSMDSVLSELAAKTKDVFVTWMNKAKNVTKDIMVAYMKSHANSAVVLVSHEQGKVYKYSGDASVEELLDWSKKCLEKKINATTEMLNMKWKPLREGYNYQKLLDEKEAGTAPQDVPSPDPYGDSQYDEQDAPVDDANDANAGAQAKDEVNGDASSAILYDHDDDGGKAGLKRDEL